MAKCGRRIKSKANGWTMLFFDARSAIRNWKWFD
jgi:hypothetical protein